MKITHLGDEDRQTACGAPRKTDEQGSANWTYKPERVTCRRCLAKIAAEGGKNA